jgi:hypothetical protein
VPDSTVRYYAESRYACSRAVLALAEYARSHGDDFEVSPRTAAAMEHQGLAVSGPDLTGVTALLDGLEGLTRQEPPPG